MLCGLDGWAVWAVFVEPAAVEPVDSLGGGELAAHHVRTFLARGAQER
jgi:hypothetical protein